MLDLGRVSNLPSVATNVVAAWSLAGNGSGLGLAGVLLGAMLLYVGGTTLNDAVDAKFDREHRVGRPIPSGVIGIGAVWSMGILYLLAGSVVLGLLTDAWPVWVVALWAVILIYDIVHKKWKGAVFVMGGCRFFLYLVAASAASDGIGAEPMVLVWAAALFLYIVGLTFVARGESTGGGVPVFAAACLVAPLVAGGISFALAGGGVTFVICMVVFLGWVGLCLRRLKGGGAGRVGRFVAGLLAGIPLIDALAISVLAPWVAVALLLALPLSLVLQRVVAAT